MADPAWLPRSAFKRLANCVFLGRLIDKARHKTRGLPMGEYMYGDNDYMDSRVFRFLGTTAAHVNAMVRSEPSDEVVARMLIQRSRKSPKQIASFSTRMLLAYGVAFAMFDADEGRTSGPIAKTLAAFYNGIIYPPFANKFRRDEARF